MLSVTLHSTEQRIESTSADTLLSCLLRGGVRLENPCGGKGTCGKCKCRVLSGDAGEITAAEARFLNDEEQASGIRLACFAHPQSDLEVELLGGERAHRVLAEGFVPEFCHDAPLRRVRMSIEKPSLSEQTPFEERVRVAVAEALGCADVSAVSVAFECLQACDAIPGDYTAVVHQAGDGSVCVLDVAHVDESVPESTSESASKSASKSVPESAPDQPLLGAAIDIGTTTVVASLVDIESGRELTRTSAINEQKYFGLDVLTRITYEIEHPDTGVRELQTAIIDLLNTLLADAARDAGMPRTSIYEIAVAANCTMMHMLLGIDARTIGTSPYAPAFTRARELSAAELGLQAARGARVYTLPSVSAYIGADIVAGAEVCSLAKATGRELFIDIGTNGEIVYSDCGRLLCCSCAAGPALEGMNISAGMRAAEGAIEDLSISEAGVSVTTIGNTPAQGLCGSGILAAVKELLRVGLVRTDGRLVKTDDLSVDDFRLQLLETEGRRRWVRLAPDVSINQADVRQVQLAKGAILSGFYALLAKAGANIEELDRVYIAGQFGAHLSAESLVGTGILPDAVKDRLTYVGNTSKTGALMALLSRTARAEMEALAHHMDYVELGATEGYERLFADCMVFPSAQEASV